MQMSQSAPCSIDARWGIAADCRTRGDDRRAERPADVRRERLPDAALAPAEAEVLPTATGIPSRADSQCNAHSVLERQRERLLDEHGHSEAQARERLASDAPREARRRSQPRRRRALSPPRSSTRSAARIVPRPHARTDRYRSHRRPRRRSCAGRRRATDDRVARTRRGVRAGGEDDRTPCLARVSHAGVAIAREYRRGPIHVSARGLEKEVAPSRSPATGLSTPHRTERRRRIRSVRHAAGLSRRVPESPTACGLGVVLAG